MEPERAQGRGGGFNLGGGRILENIRKEDSGDRRQWQGEGQEGQGEDQPNSKYERVKGNISFLGRFKNKTLS